MDTIYFNELSVDTSVSLLPTDIDGAKSSLLSFINVCFGYILSKGVGEDLALSIHNDLIFGNIQLCNEYSVGRILNELVDDGLIESDEKNRFQSFVGESFTPNWEPEFQFNNKIACGLGEAYIKNSYALSFNTLFVDNTGSWNDFFYSIVKIPATGSEKSVKVQNISNLKHIFCQLEIWKYCHFINDNPSKTLLPNKNLCNLIPQGYGMNSFDEFYSKQQSIDITIKKNIGSISAIVNGWKKSTQCPSQYRLVFSAKNYFLTIDTENSTFEVYRGRDEHQGEIYFNNDIINTSKKDLNRGVCGKKGQK